MHFYSGVLPECYWIQRKEIENHSQNKEGTQYKIAHTNMKYHKFIVSA